MPDDVPDEPPELSERFLAGMALAQTPQQQEVAREIHDRLAAGAEVDDVKDLIERMMRIVVKQRHGESVTDQPADGQTTAEEPPPWKYNDEW